MIEGFESVLIRPGGLEYELLDLVLVLVLVILGDRQHGRHRGIFGDVAGDGQGSLCRRSLTRDTGGRGRRDIGLGEITGEAHRGLEILRV